MTICRENELGYVCFTNADGVKQSLFAHQVYQSDGTPLAIYYTDAADLVVDTTGGVVSVGQCPVPQPIISYEGPLCDVDEATGEVLERYFCRVTTRFDESCEIIEPVEVKHFLTDKVTEYVPVGIEEDCSSCEVESPLGLITDLSLLKSAAVKKERI